MRLRRIKAYAQQFASTGAATAWDPFGSGGVGGGLDAENLVQVEDAQDSDDGRRYVGQGDVGALGVGVVAGGDQRGDAAGVAEGQAGQADGSAVLRGG